MIYKGMAWRLRFAHSWWLASELVRRHSELRIIRNDPEGGQGDTLWLLGPGDGFRVGINRVESGGIHFFISDETSIPYDQFFQSGDPYSFIRRIEVAAGLQPRSGALPSSPRMLAYRATAHVLMSTVCTRVPLEVSGYKGFGGAKGFNDAPEFRRMFPPAGVAPLERRPDDIFGDPRNRFWTIVRGEDVVAAFDTDGNVYQEQTVHRLAHEYATHGRNLSATLAAVLPSLLP